MQTDVVEDSRDWAALWNAEPTKMENIVSELAVGAGGKIRLCRERLGESALGDTFGLLVDVLYLKRMKR